MTPYNLEPVSVLVNERQVHVGNVSSWRDEHGNERALATSAITDEVFVTWTRGAARHLLWLIGQLRG